MPTASHSHLERIGDWGSQEVKVLVLLALQILGVAPGGQAGVTSLQPHPWAHPREVAFRCALQACASEALASLPSLPQVTPLGCHCR